MGVNLSKLIEKEEITIDYLSGKKVGIDSYNMLYQFLASIRGQDGLPLADSHGNITSHITGLFYRTINLLEKGVKPVYVFDGVPGELKAETLAKRREVRTDATKKAAQALQEGNMDDAKKYGSRALRLTKDMVDEAKEFLGHLGVPVVQAAQEGEAQASVMVAKGQFDGVVSQDFDALLFGATHLYRNIGFSGKRKVAGKNFYVDIKPEHLELEKILEQLKLTRQKLIWLGILVGTDFNDKFPRVGPKTAIKLVQEFDTFEEIIEKTGHTPEFDYKEIEDVFMNPVSNDIIDKQLEPTNPSKEKLLEFLVEKHDFSKDRVESTLNKYLTQKEEKEKQKGLSEWF